MVSPECHENEADQLMVTVFRMPGWPSSNVIFVSVIVVVMLDDVVNPPFGFLTVESAAVPCTAGEASSATMPPVTATSLPAAAAPSSAAISAASASKSSSVSFTLAAAVAIHSAGMSSSSPLENDSLML